MSPQFELSLFSHRDFVRPEELDTYNELGAQLLSELAPGTVLERIHAHEALTAAWRLHRLAKLEEQLLAPGREVHPDPMADPDQAGLQLSIDRARTQYNNLLRRATAEVRRLQVERPARPVAAETLTDDEIEAVLISEQTQSGNAAPAFNGDPTRGSDPETDRLMAEAIRQSWEDMQNDAEYQAALAEAYQRGAARRAHQAAISEQSQSAPPEDAMQAA